MMPERTSDGIAVTVQDLERRFGDFVAVDKVNFDVKRGEIFGFLGPNGAGKSTTIRMLTGILRPSGGSGTVAGLDIMTQTEQIKCRIGYMSQKFSLYDDLTVAENIEFFSGIYRIDPEKRRERQDWALEMAGLTDRRDTRTGLLPGGLKQRLALGTAVLHEPEILFLDEPTSGVDPENRRQFWDLIYDMSAKGVTVFVTTHYMDEAEYCNRIGLLYRGRLIALGTPESLKRERMQDCVLEVITDRPHEALTAAESLDSVQEGALFGSGLHLVVADEHTAIPLVRQRLESEGYIVSGLERIVPSLEDVFVSLIEETDRNGLAGRVS